jgi:Na+-driven multidrug efflux pump
MLDKIMLFALPLAASSMLQQLFNSTDVAVVGRFAGSDAQAAVGCNASVIALLVNLFVGLSVGANAVIAHYIGRREEQRIRDAVHTVVIVALVSGLILVAAGVSLARPILQMMNTPSDVLDQAVLYLRIYFLGMPFTMMYNFGSASSQQGEPAGPC